jgi:heptosyltransferase-2
LKIDSILIARNDRLGDWVLTLPLVEELKRAFPEARLDAMATPSVAPLLERYPGIGSVLPSPSPGWRGFWDAAGRVRRGGYDAVIVVHPDMRDTLVVWAAGVRVRVGNGYRGYSIFYNRRVCFHRSPSAHHEVEYNLKYLEGLGLEAPPGVPAPRLAVTEEDRAAARELLERKGFTGDAYVVIHPGCGGSSLNWSAERYRVLAAETSRTSGYAVVVTGTPGEAALAANVVGEGAGRYNVAGETDLGTLLGVLAGARLFISGNTGPMHLAAAVGTPTLSLFSPLRSGSPTRWGPWVEPSTVLVPPSFSCDACPGEECEDYNCMEAIPVEEVLAAARRLAANR